VILCLVLSKADAVVRFEGGIHQVDWEINDWVEISDNTQGKPATVDLLVGGSIADVVDVYNYSRFNIVGGLVESHVRAWGFSQVTIFDGMIEGSLCASEYSQVALYGGATGSLEFRGVSHALICGGFIGNGIKVYGGQITVVGTDFKINGESVDYGEFTSLDYPSGILTGTLVNGDSMDTYFEFYDSPYPGSVFLTPEPSTLFLLGFGAVMLRKKRPN